jgi:hypothetical protein
MERHVTILGWVRIAYSAIGLLIAGLVFVLVVGGGLISGDPEAIRITGIVGTAIAGFLALLSLPGIIGGIGLLKRWPWARYLVLILALFDLFGIPIGTLLAIYTFWVLLQDETEKLFAA